MNKNGLAFSIVGPGRVGTSLARALVEEGWRCDSIVCVRKSASIIRATRRFLPGTKVIESYQLMQPQFDVLLLTVSDDQIERVAAELSAIPRFSWRGKTALHTSGIVKVESLAKLEVEGANIGALHPIAPFARRYSPNYAKGIFYDFLGSGKSLGTAKRIVRALSSRLLVMKTEHERELLHVASVIVSNFTVIGVQASEQILSEFIPEKDARSLLGKLLSSTVVNLSRSDGIASLTGPLARGDKRVIEMHLKLLESMTSMLQFYKSTSLLGLDYLVRNERDAVRRGNFKKIRELLEP